MDANKCYEKNRWWILHYIELEKGTGENDVLPVVLFESVTQGTYLAEKAGGGVECVKLR